MELAIKHKRKLLNPNLGILKKTEDELIAGVIAGNRTSQKALYQKYFGKMAGVTLRYTKSKEEAYEVLNDAFLQVFKSMGNFQGKGSLSGWIYKIVLNTTYAYARKNYKIKEVNVELKSDAGMVENDALSNLGLEVIYDSIQKLPDGKRVVFSMYALEGLKHQEIAERLGISVSTSKWYLAQARIQLQDLLKQL